MLVNLLHYLRIPAYVELDPLPLSSLFIYWKHKYLGCCLGFPVYNLVNRLACFGLSIWGFEAYAASRDLSEASSECIHTYLYMFQ